MPNASRTAVTRKLTTALRAALAFAGAFIVWQPIGYWFVHLVPPRAHAIVTPREWLVFEIEAAVAGAIAGVWWFYSRRPTPRTRAQYWADWGISLLAIGPLLNADQLVAMPWFLWIPLMAFVAVIIGLVFGSVALFVANSINAPRAG